MSARFSQADYAQALRALMPRGPVWPDDPNSEQGRTLFGLAGSAERLDAAGSQLLELSLPGDNPDLLSEWEATLGLPDPCAGPDATVEQRQAQVRARFMSGGGLSRSRYIAFAAALGFEITITNYAPFRTGHSSVGSPLASDAWTFVLGITVLSNTSGLSADVLICELEAIKPAETTILLLS